MKDVDWDSWSLTLGWPVQGLWPSIPDGTEVVACDRSNSGMVMASTDTFGRIRLSRYPCVVCFSKIKKKIENVIYCVTLTSCNYRKTYFYSFISLLLSSLKSQLQN